MIEDKQTIDKEWISVKERLPELYQSVAFVVNNPGGDRHGEVYGGHYQGNKFGFLEFSTPGHGFAGSLWMPLPKPPKN